MFGEQGKEFNLLNGKRPWQTSNISRQCRWTSRQRFERTIADVADVETAHGGTPERRKATEVTGHNETRHAQG
jgi:hypothetical protein